MNSRKDFDVVISGMGPTGLTVALAALKANKQVLLISDRAPGFTRMQNVFVDCPRRNYLRSMFQMPPKKELPNEQDLKFVEEDLKFFKELNSHLGLGIKDIERFIFRRIQELPQYQNLSIQYEAQIQDIDMENGKVTISKTNSPSTSMPFEANFTYLIGADGYKHHALNVLAAQNSLPHRDNPKIETSENVHQFHVTAYITLKRQDGKQLVMPNKHALAGTHGDNYLYVIRLNKEKYEQSLGSTPLKLTVICELPKEIYLTKEKNNDVIFNYVKNIVNQAFSEQQSENGELVIDISNSRKYGFAKNRLKLLTFETSPMEYQRPFYINRDKYFIQAGDALINPDYRFGSGLILALMQADDIGKMFTDPDNTPNLYEERCDVDFQSLQNASAIGFFSNYQQQLAKKIEEGAEEQYQLIARTKGKGECTII